MYDRLNEAVKALLAEALPSLSGGDDPPVRTGTTDNRFKLDAHSAEAGAHAPRPDDLAFEPAEPEVPSKLAVIPDPGPRRVSTRRPCRTAAGSRGASSSPTARNGAPVRTACVTLTRRPPRAYFADVLPLA